MRYFMSCSDASRQTVVSKTQGKIEALHSVGHSVRQIAAFVRSSRNLVHQCLQWLSHGSSDYEKQPGRGKTTTIREDHRLKRMALQNRRAPSRLLSYQLADETGKQVSSRTVCRHLSETGVAYRHSGSDRRRLCLPAGQHANPHVSVNKTMATPA